MSRSNYIPDDKEDRIEHKDIEEVLGDILNELKKMNRHFSEWDGEEDGCD